jgi:hypothetical protein
MVPSSAVIAKTTYTTTINVETVVLDVCRRVAFQPFHLDLLPGATHGCSELDKKITDGQSKMRRLTLLS